MIRLTPDPTRIDTLGLTPCGSPHAAHPHAGPARVDERRTQLHPRQNHAGGATVRATQPFTPPDSTPLKKTFCMDAKTMMIGMSAMTVPAATARTSLENVELR